MNLRSILRVAAALLVASFACSSGTAGRVVSIDARFVGDPSATRFDTSLGFDVTLERAELVVGPVYAFAPADEPIAMLRSLRLRSVARAHGGLDPLDGRKVRAEVLERVLVDALSDSPRTFEALAEEGVVDELRVGLEPDTSLLEGHLAHVVGTASRDGVTWRFDAFVEGGSLESTRRVLVPFEATLAEGATLELTIDPRAWLDGVAFDRLGECATPCEFAEGSQAAAAAALGIRDTRGYRPRLEGAME